MELFFLIFELNVYVLQNTDHNNKIKANCARYRFWVADVTLLRWLIKLHSDWWKC